MTKKLKLHCSSFEVEFGLILYFVQIKMLLIGLHSGRQNSCSVEIWRKWEMSNQQCLFLVSNVFAQEIEDKKIQASKLGF